MILRAGESRCPKCGRPVYAIDNLITATPWKGVDAIAGFRDGFYHAACFDGLSWRDAYRDLDRRQRLAELDSPGDELVVVARDERFALTLRPAGKRYTLLLLERNRAFVFARPADWHAFREIVAADVPGAAGPIRLGKVGGAWELVQRVPVLVRAEFARTDLTKIRQHFAARGTDPARVPVELGALCRQLGAKPIEASCPLDRLIGTFAWPEADAEPVLTVRVEKWNTVALPAEELDDLRRFLRGLRQ
jgi:hypothetical protein